MTETKPWICECGHNRSVHQNNGNPWHPGEVCRLCAVCGRDHRYTGWAGHDFKSCGCSK